MQLQTTNKNALTNFVNYKVSDDHIQEVLTEYFATRKFIKDRDRDSMDLAYKMVLSKDDRLTRDVLQDIFLTAPKDQLMNTIELGLRIERSVKTHKIKIDALYNSIFILDNELEVKPFEATFFSELREKFIGSENQTSLYFHPYKVATQLVESTKNGLKKEFESKRYIVFENEHAVMKKAYKEKLKVLYANLGIDQNDILSVGREIIKAVENDPSYQEDLRIENLKERGRFNV